MDLKPDMLMVFSGYADTEYVPFVRGEPWLALRVILA